MKNILITVFFLFLLASAGINVMSTETVQAQSLLEKAGGAAGYDVQEVKENPTAFVEVIGRFIRVFLSMLGIIFTLLMVYGGYAWMVAKGNSEEVEKAKETIMHAVIGLVIIASAYALTYFIVEMLVSKYTHDPSFK